MQAVILAGGKGTRLHPLTTNTPKPMVPLFDKPVMEHCVELLRKHGVNDITVTVSYLARDIMDYFGDGSKWGVNIRYSIEDAPRGTAGGVKLVQPHIHETFIIVSGDAVTDFDFSAALDYHRSKSSLATLLLHEVEDPTEFGLVMCGNDGKIMRFLEKPKSDQVFTNTVNTGIYIMEPEALSSIPYDTVYDFSRELFPRFLRNQEPIYGCKLEGYWCDIGNLAQYRNAHFDALTGKANINIGGRKIDEGVYIAEDADISTAATLAAPLYVGNGAEVRRNAFLGGYAVVGDMSLIGEGASVSRSVVGRNSLVGRLTNVTGSVIAGGHQVIDHVDIRNRVVAGGEDMPISVERDEVVACQSIPFRRPAFQDQPIAA